MDFTSGTITLITMFLMVILLIGVIYSRLHWAAKSGFIIMSLVCACVSFVTFRAALGWSVKLPKAPAEFQFIFGAAREPISGKGDPGAIYLWIIEPGTKEPRSIQIPYSREAHKKVEQAKKKVGEGKTVYMKGGTGDDDEDGDEAEAGQEGKGKGKKGKRSKPGRDAKLGNGATGQSDTDDDSDADIDFIPPPNTLPEKD
jgi:hypothetical protein